MKLIILLLIALTGSSKNLITQNIFFYFKCYLFKVSVHGNGFDNEYVSLILREASKVNEQNFARLGEESSRATFKCSTGSSSNPKPTSVHKLKPNDIDVIGAIGDSLTAANGAKATTVIGLLEECRGVSWW